jgi:hypothetical protein
VTEYEFLAALGANVSLQLAMGENQGPEIHVLGNRAGLLSLANVLLWLEANAWRREFLSFAELPFVRVQGLLSLVLRVSDEDGIGSSGTISNTDRGEQFEWTVTEGELRHVGLTLHRLACTPEHEYDWLNVNEHSAAKIQVRMTDRADWLKDK